MNDTKTESSATAAKVESQKNPNRPKFTDDQPASNTAAPAAPAAPAKATQEAAGGESATPSSPAPPKDPPKVDAHVKVARQETAQETVHEVMTKKEASKLVSKETPEKK